MSFNKYRRNLPHWREDDALYFVTWRIATGKRILEPHERSVVLDSLKHFHGQRYDLVACVVMDDHVHVLVHPHEGRRLEDLVHAWKSFTSHIILRKRGLKAPFWQDESFDRIIRDAEEFDEKLNYIYNNPFKRWPVLEEYEWTWWPAKDAPA